jgi:trehalose 6-phosphate phosphatase
MLMSNAPEHIDPGSIALFLDVDGTLLEICDRPGDVAASSALIAKLQACCNRLDGAMALVSGRSIAEVDRIFSPALFPVAGAHGAEMRRVGEHVPNIVDEPLSASVLEALEDFTALHPGLLLEKKRSGVSLHYRKAPELETDCRQLVQALLEGIDDSHRLIAGKKVFEIAPAAHNKGAAIEAFLSSPPFLGRVPVFIGDDVTDEDGFGVVNRLGGASIRVGEADSTVAVHLLRDVASVERWLDRAILNTRIGRTNSGAHSF